MTTLSFLWPMQKERHTIVPLFMPFAGCKTRCLYCSQQVQTGQHEASLAQLLEQTKRFLCLRQERSLPPAELAFYGGTFSAQAPEQLSLCLTTAYTWYREGLISSWRCSTRPDCLTLSQVQRFTEHGCRCIELGVQSFSTQVLHSAKRFYDAKASTAAINAIKASHLRCGVQLLPGLPHSTPQLFVQDVQQAIALGADFLRFYPCLVLQNTGLAALYKQGLFQPWSYATTVQALSIAMLYAAQAGIVVTRIGVAYEPGLAEHILAGPWVEGLGTMVMGQSLFLRILLALWQGLTQDPAQDSLATQATPPVLEQQLYNARQATPAASALATDSSLESETLRLVWQEELSAKVEQALAQHGLMLKTITLPKFSQGYLYGQNQVLKPKLAALGMHKGKIHWHEGNVVRIELCTASQPS